MRIRRRRRPARRAGKWRLLLLFCLLIYILTARLLSPMAVELARTEIQRVALESVYEAVEEVISQSQQNLTEVTQRSDGSIAAVEADPQALAVLQASLGTAISQKLSQNRTAGIRLGNLTPVALLSGKGPEDHLKLKPGRPRRRWMFRASFPRRVSIRHSIVCAWILRCISPFIHCGIPSRQENFQLLWLSEKR